MATGLRLSVVVTGAGGNLGMRVVHALIERGATVRGLGRGAAPAEFPAAWATVNLRSGQGLAPVLIGADIVVHAASDPFSKSADIDAAHHLAGAAREAGVSHIVYVQIAGIDDAARLSAYYRAKLICERVLKDGQVPCSTASATQFHNLIDRVLRALSIGPILALPAFTLQPVDAGFFAERLADHVFTLHPAGITVCGPEALNSREMAVAWQFFRERQTLIVRVPGFGPLAAFGRIHAMKGIAGGLSWREWLQRAVRRSRSPKAFPW